MKKVVIAVLSLLAVFEGYAQADTVQVNRPESVTIITGEQEQSIEIKGNAENPDYHFSRTTALEAGASSVTKERLANVDFNFPFKKKRHSRDRFEVGGIALGLSTALSAPERLNVNMGASFEILADHLLNWVYYPQNNGHSLQIGAGIAWRNFRMNGRNRFIKQNENVVLGGYPEGADIQFSRIKLFSWTIPLMYGYDFNKDVSLKLGPVIYFNTYASLKTKYTEADGTKQEAFDKNIHPNPVTIHLQGQLTWKAIGVYVKYSPCHVLNTDFGPEFQAFSAGLSLFY